MTNFDIMPPSEHEGLARTKRSAIAVATTIGLVTWLILVIPLAIIIWRAAL